MWVGEAVEAMTVYATRMRPHLLKEGVDAIV